MNKVILNSKKSDEIKLYWNDRAKNTDPQSIQATTYDVYLRELEIKKLKDKISDACLPHGSTVVDLGCGDGHSTMSLAKNFSEIFFIGIDWSEEMLELAEKKLMSQPAMLDRVSFRLGDMRNLSNVVQKNKFEVFFTSRSLINLTSSLEQYNTISQIAMHLKVGGYYFCIENFIQAQNNFNLLRKTMGLPEIPVRWHNHFFDEEEFFVEAGKFFDSFIIDNFLSSYYLATRIIYSAGCHTMGEEPDYFHPIHQTAGKLPVMGDFCPIKLVSMRRKF